jgi:TolB-like protein/DNA-binding winged helix-turn-helix (wHTH) protein/Tfp pilus assembly protein PilF
LISIDDREGGAFAERDEITLLAAFSNASHDGIRYHCCEEQWMTVRDATGAAGMSTRVVLAHEPIMCLGALTIAPALRQIVHSDGRDEIVEPKVMEVLVVLLRADGGILTRDELCAAAWDGRIVGDDAINRVLARLRRLSEGIGDGVYRIETITKVGYRLVRLCAASGTIAPTPAAPIEHVAASGPPVVAGHAPVPPAIAAKRRIDRRGVIGGGVALAAVAAGASVWHFLPQAEAAADSVAVLPFANLSGDPAQAYFSDGIAEELRSALARILRLRVAARASSELMRAVDIPTAATRLGVANIVTGSVRHGNGTIRVAAQLVDGTTGLTRWSDSYDRVAGDVLTIETGIAENVAAALNIVLGRAEKLLLTAGGTTDPAARDAYLRGAAFWAEQKFADAVPAYAVAVAIDPNYALARTGLAITLVSAAFAGTGDPAPALAKAEAEARRAVALAPTLGAPMAALGYIRMARLDLRGAAAAQAAAYRLTPGDAYVVRNYAKLQAVIGNGDAAVRAAGRYAALDPLAPNAAGALGAILYRAGRLEDAIVAFRRALARVPDDPEALIELSYILLATGRTADALALTRSMPSGGWQEATVQSVALARLGDRAGADAALARLRASDTAWWQVGQVLAQRGETDAAFAALDRAYALRDGGLSDLKVDAMAWPLHGDPRFAALLRRIGFP